MNVLVIDLDFDALDFVLRCREYGHKVKWYRYSTTPSKIGTGFGIDIIDDWRPAMPWAKDGLVWISDNRRFLTEIDRYRDMGCKIFGPSARSAELEIDRNKGMQLFLAAGIDVPAYEEFSSFKDAFSFALKSDRAWVFKVLGSNTDKSLTYVSSDAADLCSWLDLKLKAGKDIDIKCILQEKVDLLCEMCVLGIFGPDGFLEDKWLEGFEHKKLMPGDSGPNTGEMGTVQRYVKTSLLAEEVLCPLTTALKALGHVGFVDVNVGIDTHGNIWPFEFTVRPGWPQFHLQNAAHRDDPVQWMRDLLDGKDTLRVSYDETVGVICGMLPKFPNYASVSNASLEGLTISGIDDKICDDIHPIDVMCGNGFVLEAGKVVKDKVWQTAGEYVMAITAQGKGISKARDRVYRIVDKIKFPNKTFRNDIGCKIIETIPKLQEYGYAEEFST